MSMTIAERILAEHCDKGEVRPGELIEAQIDFALANDITAPLAIEAFHQVGAKQVFDPQRVALIPDHFAPNKDIASAMQIKVMREFAAEQQLPFFF